MSRPRLLVPFLLLAAVPAQHQGPPAPGAAAAAIPAPQDGRARPAYPERDILSPFRKCDEIYAPPDAVFRELRIMRDLANQNATQCSFDDRGREVCALPAWAEARQRLAAQSLDAGWLAEVLRRSRNADERDIALYAIFWCVEPAHVFNLISHIPGEPEARARERAYPRAVHFVRAHLGRKWGDLSADEKAGAELPEIGSPAAKAAGITREPRDSDHLFFLNLRPFFQLLDLDSAMDQAQGLWFLKECFRLRRDLALLWLEPALPRLRELAGSPQKAVVEQVIGVVSSLAPNDLAAPAAAAPPAEIVAWIDQAVRAEFPPIRVPSSGLALLFPSPERDAMASKGLDLLRRDAIGEAVNGKRKDGRAYRGFRLGRVPDEFQPLPLKTGMVLTAINGTVVSTGQEVLAAVQQALTPGRGSLLVEYVLDGVDHALEVRVM